MNSKNKNMFRSLLSAGFVSGALGSLVFKLVGMVKGNSKLPLSFFHPGIEKDMIENGLKVSNNDRFFKFLNWLYGDFIRLNLTIEQCAYILATAYHETGKFRLMREAYNVTNGCGNDSGNLMFDYFECKYGYLTSIGKELGNKFYGDGGKFYGRGFVQITGRSNYQKFGSVIGLDLLNDPGQAEKDETAYKVIISGMLGLQNVTFTGLKLTSFINSNIKDYRNARRVVNGLDKADMIQGYALKFERILKDYYKREMNI